MLETQVSYDLLVHRLFESWADRCPERTALTMAGASLTYGELNRRANCFAGWLSARRIGKGDLVGIFLDRSFDMIASFIAILKVGAAYVPLDSNYPAERLGLMVKDTGMKLILSSGTLAAHLPCSDVPVLDVEQIKNEPPAFAAHPLEDAEIFPDQVAYVMYTSGSTGVPKGVAVPHRGIVRLVQEPGFVNISTEDVFLQISPVSFDAATFEIWGALTNGARLALMPPGQPALEKIGETIGREQVSILWLTAGLFNLMVDERVSDLGPIRQLLAGGDVLSVPHIRRAIKALPTTQIINGYGPTENTTFTCCYTVPRDLPLGDSVPIGHAIHGTTVHIVDEQLNEVPDGVEGELITGGVGLALGYWNRPELTAERFITAKFPGDSNDRFYRTGDYVRRRPDGELEFLGRKDNQVKLRGFRIEMGEIESALRQHPNVRDCVVAVHSDCSGNRSLAAWMVSNNGRTAFEAIREHAANRLPEHMIPSFWMWLEKLPLNANGKVDRARLPSPLNQDETTPREPPKNDIEKLLVALWQELLGGRAVGVTDSYFEMGANSLLVAQAHERLRRRHGFELQLPDMFRFVTVRSLSDHLRGVRQQVVEPTQNGRNRAALRVDALSRFKRK